MFCTNCGNKIADGNSYCTSCGNVVNADNIDNSSKVIPKKISIVKCILLALVIAVIIFLIPFIINFITQLAGVKLSDGILSMLVLIQLTLPMITVFFGPIIIYTIKYCKQKKS